MKMLMEGKVLESEEVQAYRDEIRAAVEKIEKDKEQDRKMWHSRIKVMHKCDSLMSSLFF